MEQEHTYKGNALALVQWAEEQVSLSSLLGSQGRRLLSPYLHLQIRGRGGPHHMVAVECDDTECPVLSSSYVVCTNIS